MGHYVDIKGRYILKIGTTNDLKRRAAEHTRNYKKTREFTMPENSCFVYDWWRPLSKYNTLRYEGDLLGMTGFSVRKSPTW